MGYSKWSNGKWVLQTFVNGKRVRKYIGSDEAKASVFDDHSPWGVLVPRCGKVRVNPALLEHTWSEVLEGGIGAECLDLTAKTASRQCHWPVSLRAKPAVSAGGYSSS